MRRVNGFDGAQGKILPFALDGDSSFFMKEGIGCDRCACPPDACAHFCEPPSSCVARLDGDIRTARCVACFPESAGQTWHQNGDCLRCRSRLARPGAQ